jgi:tRNA-binding EMAP/Myf-like protein
MPFVVGVVEECTDISPKLKKVSVNVGGEEALTIVTNASNVRQGTRTCVALVGTIVDDVEVKKMSVGGTTSEGMLCDSKMLNWAGGAEGLCVQVPPSFSPGDSAPTSKPRMDGGTTPVVPDKSDKELKAEAKAAKKAEAAAKKEARKTKKLVGKSGNDEVDQTAEDVSKIKMEE